MIDKLIVLFKNTEPFFRPTQGISAPDTIFDAFSAETDGAQKAYRPKSREDYYFVSRREGGSI